MSMQDEADLTHPASKLSKQVFIGMLVYAMFFQLKG